MPRYMFVPAMILLLSPLTFAECNTAPFDQDESITGLGPFTVDVLANATDNEGQMLTVEVTSTTCPGTASVSFEMVQLDPEPRIYEDCKVFYSVADIDSTSNSTIHITMPTHIFSDSFETGNTSQWSN